MVNVVGELADSKMRFVPDVLVAGGNSGGAIDALAAVLTRAVTQGRTSLPMAKDGQDGHGDVVEAATVTHG